MLLDSATSLLRRVEFRLDRLQPRDTPTRLEGYTTFTSPSPYVVLPDSTVAGWWRTAPGDRKGHVWGPSDAARVTPCGVTPRDWLRPRPDRARAPCTPAGVELARPVAPPRESRRASVPVPARAVNVVAMQAQTQPCHSWGDPWPSC